MVDTYLSFLLFRFLFSFLFLPANSYCVCFAPKARRRCFVNGRNMTNSHIVILFIKRIVNELIRQGQRFDSISLLNFKKSAGAILGGARVN